MCLSMILGWFMENPLACGRAGTGIRDCIWKDLGSRLALVLELVFLAGLVGAGDTGDTIGIATGSCSTTTATFPTAESLSTVSTSMLPADFTAGMREDSRVASTDFHRIARRALIPAPLAALIMEERQEVSLLAANRVLAAAFMGAEGFPGAVGAAVRATANASPIPRT